MVQFGQAASRPVDRHARQHPGCGRRSTFPEPAESNARELPPAVRQRRRDEGARVLHPALRRRAARNNAGALRRVDIRSLLLLVGHVRPANISDCGGERPSKDRPWRYGAPPKDNADFAFVQHVVRYFAPKGEARLVLANGSKTLSQSGEGDIRKSLIAADIVDCMRALPDQFFHPAQIPACLWFLARGCQRRGETLFDARARSDGGPDAPRTDRQGLSGVEDGSQRLH